MTPSRRAFLQQSLSVAGTFALAPPGCGDTEKSTISSALNTPREFEPSYLEMEREGKLKLVEKELWEILRSCRCCPRRCGVDRLKGETGVCSSTAKLKVHSAGAHLGEEKPLVGKSGSGTIFFSNCNLLCCFCQNWEINHRGDGSFSSPESLAGLMIGLQTRGCHNINLVTPTHVVPHIVKALRIAIRRGLKLPLVYNTGGYDNIEMVKKLDGIVDIYLPDFKYQDGALAAWTHDPASGHAE